MDWPISWDKVKSQLSADRGVYNVTIKSGFPSSTTEITDTDLIAQLNKLPKQGGFLLNLMSGHGQPEIVSVYPAFNARYGEQGVDLSHGYAYIIALGPTVVAFSSNADGTWYVGPMG